ncbi:MAG: hypothetical protein IJF38_06075 [Clostridia bacterium]|nr:hypothetical protein [Clostridia bacterium]
MNKTYLSYEQFGAVGDGVNDDILAIVACHEEANRTGTPVKTRDGAKYYIGGRNLTAVIKTDVDFGTSEFIIDDRNVESRTSFVFLIGSDYDTYKLDIDELHSKSDIIALPHDGRAFLRVFNSNQKIFIRKGLNQNPGSSKSDVFIVDENGRIETDLDWTYPQITHCAARRIDEKPITVSGGIFTTIANQEESFYNYYNRGFQICRDNVRIKNITHFVKGELDHGAPYNGFLSVSECAFVSIEDCLLTPHFTYQTPAASDPTKTVSMGTYDLVIYGSIKVSLIRITQTIDIMDKRYWGLMGSNFCKEMVLEDCIISRFDAHMGVTHVRLSGCTLGHQCLNLIGCGSFLLENCKLYGKQLINLRSDYGSTWRGDATIRNCEWLPISAQACIFSGNNTADHDFGYTCYMPENILIDGLKILDGKFGINQEKLYYLFTYDWHYSPEKPYKYVTTKKITVSNVFAESGREIELCEKPELYEGIEFVKR